MRVWMKSAFILQKISELDPSHSIRFHPVSRDDRPYSGKLFDLLPTSPSYEYLKRPGSHTLDSLIVLKAVDLALFEEFLELELSARGQWEADKIEEWKAIHAVCYRIFYYNSAFTDSWLYSTQIVVKLGHPNCKIFAGPKRGNYSRADKICTFIPLSPSC
jgi:hypothetical protein